MSLIILIVSPFVGLGGALAMRSIYSDPSDLGMLVLSTTYFLGSALIAFFSLISNELRCDGTCIYHKTLLFKRKILFAEIKSVRVHNFRGRHIEFIDVNNVRKISFHLQMFSNSEDFINFVKEKRKDLVI